MEFSIVGDGDVSAFESSSQPNLQADMTTWLASSLSETV